MVVCAKAVPVGVQIAPSIVTVPSVPKFAPEIVIDCWPADTTDGGNTFEIWGGL